MDPFWPLLQAVHDLFFQLVASPLVTVRLLRQLITPAFVQALLGLLRTAECDERDRIRNLLHRLYARRKMLRGAFRQAYLEAVYEWADPGGVAELLQINAAIIAGFMVPLRPEHQAFFREVAAPLFKAQSFRHFSDQIL